MPQLSRREFLAAAAATLPAVGTAQDSDPATLTLRRAGDLIRRRDLSPVELTEACLHRIDAYDSALNAFITITRDEVLAAARTMEAEQRNGRWRGPLHGVPTTDFFENLDPEVAAAPDVRELDVPAAGSVVDVWNPEIYAYHEPWTTTSPELYQETTRRLIERAEATRPAVYAEARRIQRVFAEVDLLITPTRRVPPGLTVPSGPPGNASPGPAPAGGLNNAAAFNIYGLPTVSVPYGFTEDGLPIGMQISGTHFAETTVIAMAHAYEQATEWHRRRPRLTTW